MTIRGATVQEARDDGAYAMTVERGATSNKQKD